MKKTSNSIYCIGITISLSFALLLTGCSTNTKLNDEQSDKTNKSIITNTPAPTRNIPKQDKYETGVYETGINIPAGEYIVFADSSFDGYMEVSSDSTGKPESILSSESFSYNTIVAIADGQVIKLIDAYAIPFDEATELITTKSGTFKVGIHIPAGEYKLTAIDTSVGYAFYEISSDSTHSSKGVISSEAFEKTKDIIVSEGQYLRLTGAKISK